MVKCTGHFHLSFPSFFQVDVSVNEADHSQPEGTNIQAFLADWQCAEDELMNELKEDVG